MITPAPIIHIVDDDTSFRTSMSRLLSSSGYQTALYESGRRFSTNFRSMKLAVFCSIQMVT
jgi:FixJ family two-component response regulator